MDEKTLADLKTKVEQAEKLKKQMDTLDEFIASCNADIGYLNITMNYRNQNEVKLVNQFGPREVFEAFKDDVKTAAENLKKKLETEFKNLK